ncbi:MAG: DUF2294 family protein [Chitinivibrionales bacterium]|nr:DUF2294 family protein [Chitinivibrionales bacterium]
MAKSLITKGQLEAALGEIITRFEKDNSGRGPLETKTYILDDMVIFRLKGILTRAEQKLVKDGRNAKARDLVKQMRIELIENNRAVLEAAVKSLTKRKIKSLHVDVSTSCGEKILVLVLDKPLEFA